MDLGLELTRLMALGLGIFEGLIEVQGCLLFRVCGLKSVICGS